MTRFLRPIEIALLCAVAVVACTAWLSLRPDPSISSMLTSVSGVICNPSRRQLILVPRPYPPGIEPVLVLPKPPRGWHYRPDDRLETDAQ